jgi:predicted lactoylglutathione lyase
MKQLVHALVAILPCNDLDASERFYARLGFTRIGPVQPAEGDCYRILRDASGAQLHLNQAVPGWLQPGQNPGGLYFYSQAVDELAAGFRGETIEKQGPEHKPWGMYEFSLSDPDGTLVRVGWSS